MTTTLAPTFATHTDMDETASAVMPVTRRSMSPALPRHTATPLVVLFVPPQQDASALLRTLHASAYQTSLCTDVLMTQQMIVEQLPHAAIVDARHPDAGLLLAWLREQPYIRAMPVLLLTDAVPSGTVMGSVSRFVTPVDHDPAMVVRLLGQNIIARKLLLGIHFAYVLTSRVPNPLRPLAEVHARDAHHNERAPPEHASHPSARLNMLAAKG